MSELEEIAEMLERYVLRIDIEAKYAQIIELSEVLQQRLGVFNLNSSYHLDAIKRNGILLEVNFVNLKKAILNPTRFLVVDHKGRISFIDNSSIKDRIQDKIQQKRLSWLFGYPSGIMKVLVYQYILSDKILEEIRGRLKQRFKDGLKELKSTELIGYGSILSLFYKKDLYSCCNKLGTGHFDALLLKFSLDFAKTKDDYQVISFVRALESYEGISPLKNRTFARLAKRAEANFNRVKNKVEPSRRKKYKFSIGHAVAIPILIFLARGAINYVSDLKQDDKFEYQIEPLDISAFSFFQLLFFDQKGLFENQNNAANLSNFSPCEFKIENTQFKNNNARASDRYKEVLLLNKTQKDIIVIWMNGSYFEYTFLAANGSFAKLRPMEGKLKLYAGNNAQSTIEASEDQDIAINFRFGTFTREDSLLLRKEFDLETIGSVEGQYTLIENRGLVEIQSGADFDSFYFWG